MASAVRPTSAAILSRSICRSLLGTRWAQAPSTLFTPFRASVTTVSNTTRADSVPEPLLNPSSYNVHGPKTMKDFQAIAQQRRKEMERNAVPTVQREDIPIPKRPSTPTEPLTTFTEQQLDPSVKTLLPLLRAQSPHYITIHIHEKPYLVTLGDSVRLPFLMHGVEPGDILRLNRATLLGSRDYTLKAGAWEKSDDGSIIHGTQTPRKWIDERLFLCRARVIGVESEPLRIKEKTKRRQRRVKRVKSKHRYTVLRICELQVNDLDALEATRMDNGATGGEEMKVTANSAEV